MEKKTKTPGYFLKQEWGLVFDRLSNDEIGSIIRNMYLLDDQEELIEMTKAAEIFFIGTVKSTQEFNREKYDRKIAANKSNGAKGGAPSGNQNARKNDKLTQNNPNQHKEKEIVKEKEIEKVIENEKVIEKTIVNTVSSIEKHLNDSNVLETIDSFTFNQKKQEFNQEIDSYNKRDNSLPKGAMTVGEYLRSKNGN